MSYHSIRGAAFGYNDDGSVLVNGRRLSGDGNPVGLGRGQTFYVSSAVAGTDGRSPDTAVATIVAATALCTANQGDTIIVLPNHTENVAAATALSAVAGIRIIGLGRGVNRPKVTFTTANTATYSLAVAGVYIENIVFVANFLSIAAAITLTTAVDIWLVNCEFRDTSSVLNFLNIVKSTGAANTVDGLTLLDNRWLGLGTTSVNSFILSANDIDRAVWLRNYVKLNRTATAAVLATISAGILTGLECRWNIAISQQTADTGGGFINVGGTTSTGVVANNYLGDLSTTDLFVTTSVGLSFFENKKTGVISASGYLLPATDS